MEYSNFEDLYLNSLREDSFLEEKMRSRIGDIEEKREKRKSPNRSKKYTPLPSEVTKTISMQISTLITRVSLVSLPKFFSWEQTYLQQESIDDYQKLLHRVNENTAIIQGMTDEGKITCSIVLFPTPSGGYTINTVQCVYSREAIVGLIQILEVANKIKIAEDGINYIALCSFLSSFSVNQKGTPPVKIQNL